MIIIEVSCDRVNDLSNITIFRVDNKTGAYSPTRYVIPRGSLKERSLLSVLQGDRCVRTEVKGASISWGYKQQEKTIYNIRDGDDSNKLM